jgi:hypothetical protein
MAGFKLLYVSLWAHKTKAFLAVASMSAILNVMVPGQSFAAVIYTYVGNPFTDVVDDPSIPGTHNTGMHVRASLLLAAPLPANMPFQNVVPLAVTLSDGRNTLDSWSLNDPAESPWLNLETDALGNIVTWIVSMSDDLATPPNSCTVIGCISPQFVQIGTSFFSTMVSHDQGSLGSRLESLSGPGFVGISFLLDIGNNESSPGLWTANTVSEPSTTALYAFGLFVVALCRRRVRNSTNPTRHTLR